MTISFNNSLPNDIKQTYSPFLSTQRPKQEPKKQEKTYTIYKSNNPHLKTIVLSSVGASVLAISGVALLLVNGNSGKLLAKVKNLAQKAGDKLFDLSCTNKHLKFLEGVSMKINKFLNSKSGIAKGSMNFSTVKSSFLQEKVYAKNKKVKAATDKFSNTMKKWTIDITQKKWNNTKNAGEALYNKVSELNIPDKNLVENFKKALNETANGFESRLKTTEQPIKEMRETVSNNLFGKDTFTHKAKKLSEGYMPEEILKENKKNYVDNINGLKRSVSNNIHDNVRNIDRHISELNAYIDPTDVETKKALRAVKASLKEYNVSGGSKNTAHAAGKSVQLQLESLKNTIIQANKGKNASEIEAIIEKAKGTIDPNNMGELQKIIIAVRDEYGADSQQFKEVEKLSKDFIKKLDDTVDSESDKMYDKLRDIAIGGASADIVDYATTAAAIGVAVGMGDTKEERVSAGLEKGIPGLGALLTSVVLTMKQASTPTALISGALSGLVLNKIGSAINKEYLESQGKKYHKNEDVVF